MKSKLEQERQLGLQEYSVIHGLKLSEVEKMKTSQDAQDGGSVLYPRSFSLALLLFIALWFIVFIGSTFYQFLHISVRPLSTDMAVLTNYK